jgi:hypothetical protein
MTVPIPEPEMLNPDRVNRDSREDFTADEHKSRGDLLAKALGESCDYARQLWQTLNAQRTYLLDSLPSDPRKPGTHRTSASPTGPDDEEGWENWVAAFSSVTSALCGPHGDSGFGLSEAHDEARVRREAPQARLDAKFPPVREPAARPAPSTPSKVDAAAKTLSPAKIAAGIVVGFLALRGLRPRR